MEYNELRKRYPKMYYHGYAIEEDEKTIRITYDLEIESLSSFAPTFTLQKPCGAVMMKEYRLFKEAVFSLGMVELISYWKLACPPCVIVECGSLTEEQVSWWKKLYFHGLGEFFYTNGIETDMDSFMDIVSTGEKATGKEIDYAFHGNLIPVGGGKDSFVSLDVLKQYKEENYAFVIGNVKSAIHASHAAGYDGDHFINPMRTLDERMLKLNKEGYLNGHTPFSAMAAFAAYLTALVYHCRYIVLSNEASANESTVKDSTVNHQYSKTFEFEVDFNKYVKDYLAPSVHYFSLLRGISELQIAAIFSTLKQYHSVFRSCNVGQKEEKWCGHCAKCLFVCIMLQAFLSKEEVIAIFGRDMLNDESMLDLFKELTGIVDNKPFECVGTRDEVNQAVMMAISRFEKDGLALPVLYKYYLSSSYADVYRNKPVNLMEYQKENLVPAQYETLLLKRLEELK